MKQPNLDERDQPVAGSRPRSPSGGTPQSVRGHCVGTFLAIRSRVAWSFMPCQPPRARRHGLPGLPGTFLAALRKQDGIAARALEFLILTATRTGETLGATWDEVDMR